MKRNIHLFLLVLFATGILCANEPLVSIHKPVYSNQNSVVLPNLQTLRHFKDTKISLLYVKGYSSAFDGGEGWFCYDPARAHIDNGGTIVNGWVRQYSGAVNVKWFGARTDGSNVAKAVQKAIDSGASEIFFPKGTYRLDGKKKKRIIRLRSNLWLRGEAGTVFDFSHNPIGDHHSVTESYISGQGELGKSYPVTNGATEGSRMLDVPENPFTSGELVLVYSDDTVDRQQPVRRGELLYIDHVENGKKVIFQGVLNDTYVTRPRIAKVSPLENISFENITFVGSGRNLKKSIRTDLGIVIQYGRNITIRNCRFENVDNTAIDLESVIGFHIENNRIMFQPKGENKYIQYGIKYSNASRDGYIVANRIYNGKHAIVQGHTRKLPGITRNVIVSGNFILGTWHAAIVTHGSAEYLDIVHNRIDGCMRGIEVRVKHIRIESNTVMHVKRQGILLKDASMDITVKNNNIAYAGSYGIYVNNLRSCKGGIIMTNNILRDSYGGIGIDALRCHHKNTKFIIRNNCFVNIQKKSVSVYGTTVKNDNNDVFDLGTRTIQTVPVHSKKKI